jgi:hypothetical protein
MIYIMVDFSRNIGMIDLPNGNCSKYMMLQAVKSP